MSPGRNWSADQTDVNAAEAEPLRRQSSAEPEAMLHTLDHLRGRYGSAQEYLLGGGATPDDLEALGSRLLDGASRR